MTASYGRITGPDGHLAGCEDFAGNSLRGHGIDSYAVFSYGTCIALRETDGTLIVNARKFSTTTTRGQNAVRAWVPHDRLVEVDCPRGATARDLRRAYRARVA